MAQRCFNRLGNVGFSEFSLLSSFGRLNYNYESKYLISLAVRRDGSSKFGNNKKYGMFPLFPLAGLLPGKFYEKL